MRCTVKTLFMAVWFLILPAAASAQQAQAEAVQEAAPAQEAAAEEAPAQPAGNTNAQPDGENDEEENPDKAPKPKPKAAASDLVRLHLMDGSIIAGKLTVDALQVETTFGPLNVPIRSLKSFTPGLGSHPSLAAEIARLIENLASL